MVARKLDENILKQETTIVLGLLPAPKREKQLSLNRGRGGARRRHHDSLAIDELDRHVPAGGRLECEKFRRLETWMCDCGHLRESTRVAAGDAVAAARLPIRRWSGSLVRLMRIAHTPSGSAFRSGTVG